MTELAVWRAGLPAVRADHGYGVVVMPAVPGADDIQVHEPRHTTAYER